MGMATSYSAQLVGLDSRIITVEVDISNGLNSFSIVGLGDRAVIEAKDRISAAIKNTGFISPKQKNQKVIISLAPADMHKEGPSFDLAMTIAYLAAAGDIELDPERKLLLGELSLEGNLRKVTGILPMLCQAPAHGFTSAFIPKDNETEASLAQGITIYAVRSVQEVIGHLTGSVRLTPILQGIITPDDTGKSTGQSSDMSDIRGNETAKRGLEIAAAGAHNIIMCGPPGTGKTMLAHGFSSILPDLSYEHAVEVTCVHSAADILAQGLITKPPFRAPHHTASYPAVIGGGSIPRPGEITLAHRGVLFLDEFPEFDRSVIEALRQPLEERSVTISRARATLTFPAQCILIASMNPCPCGLGKDHGCTCPEHVFKAYRRRLSGPIMDRIDIWATVAKVDYEKLSARHVSSENSITIRSRVSKARSRQYKRFKEKGISLCYNSEMGAREIEICSILSDDARSTLKLSAEKMGLSGRAFHRVIKVAQTIADLAASDLVEKGHILEALQYREKI